MGWVFDLLRCGSCRFSAYYALPFYAALADAGQLNAGWLVWGAVYWSLFSLGTELINRLSDRVEDATNRPERTRMCHTVGYNRLARINTMAWIAVAAMAAITVALHPQVPLAVFLALGILSSINYSYGIRLKKRRYLALFVLTFPYGGTFFTGWTAAYPPGTMPYWFDDLLFRTGPFLLVGGMFMYSLAGIKDITDIEGDEKIGYRGLLVTLVKRYSRGLLMAFISAPFITLAILLLKGLLPPRYGVLFPAWPMSWLLVLCVRKAAAPPERKMAREFFYHLWMAFMAIEMFLYVSEPCMLWVIFGVLAYWIATTQWLHWHGGVWRRDLETFSTMVRQAIFGIDAQVENGEQ